MNDELWHAVKNTPRVTGFVGGGNSPVPLSADEVNSILYRQASSAERPRPKMTFEKNDTVRIIDGPFANFSGKVDEVNPRAQHAARDGDDLRPRDAGGTGILAGREKRRRIRQYGKESYRAGEAADSGRQGHAGAPGRHGARSAGRQHHGLLQGVQREDVGARTRKA